VHAPAGGASCNHRRQPYSLVTVVCYERSHIEYVTLVTPHVSGRAEGSVFGAADKAADCLENFSRRAAYALKQAGDWKAR
jgi:hypothetical protein